MKNLSAILLSSIAVLTCFACATAGGSGGATPPPRPVKAQTAAPASVVEIDFAGSMVHLLPATGTKKTVVLDIPAHNFIIQLPVVDDEAVLKNFATVVNCSSTACTLTGVKKGTAFRVVAEDGSSLTPANLTTDPTYDALVPKIGALADPPIPAESDLDPELWTDVPDNGTKFEAYWDFTGGVLSAMPFCGRASFVINNVKQPSRRFAALVRLTASSDKPVILQYRAADGAKWQDVTFKQPDYVQIFVLNQPASGADHFKHHAMIAKGATKLPDIDHSEECPRASEAGASSGDLAINGIQKTLGTMIGCASTNWP